MNRKNHKLECGWMKKLMEVITAILDKGQKKQPMNSFVLIMRMVYQICTHQASHSNENGVIQGDYTDIQDHCDNLSGPS